MELGPALPHPTIFVLSRLAIEAVALGASNEAHLNDDS
jgi:hypothetical protein